MTKLRLRLFVRVTNYWKYAQDVSEVRELPWSADSQQGQCRILLKGPTYLVVDVITYNIMRYCYKSCYYLGFLQNFGKNYSNIARYCKLLRRIRGMWILLDEFYQKINALSIYIVMGVMFNYYCITYLNSKRSTDVYYLPNNHKLDASYSCHSRKDIRV